ncbi:MAG: tripartite tricarboxylate transporter TctB family protein [Comamonadaceae bacterium]|nr:tripartite tricarboxylate transporter TctB family protein [Comamonadaceae bacterium]
MTSPLPNITPELRPDHPPPAQPGKTTLFWESVLGAAVMLIGVGLGVGALSISSEAGYGGVGSNFLPWVVATALVVCGAFMVWESRTGGFRAMEDAPDQTAPDWGGFVWVSAGLLLNAALITTLGFILSCALCYVLAVQGLRRAYGQKGNTWVVDIITGLAIAAPVYWMFTKFLAINLPGLTGTGWL